MDIHTIEICAGVGMLGEGLRAGLDYMGHTNRTIAYLEREAYAASVLVARMEDGSLDGAPVWPDLLTFDGQPWRGVVDCIAAGFPCQDLSLAGKRAGLDGARSGLFFNILDIADDCGARYLFLENVAGIASATASVVDEAEGALEERAAARVLGELADRGWDAEWLTLSASDVGASHGRARWFCWAWRQLENTKGHGRPKRQDDGRGNVAGKCAPWGAGDAGNECPAMDNPGRVQRRAGHEQDRSSIAEAGEHKAHDGTTDGGVELGDTRLQHQYLQQRQDGVEYQGAGERMADAERVGSERWRDAGNVARTGSDIEGEAREWQRRRPAADGGDCTMGLFAPGPADNRWPGILASQPHLTPALSKEAESILCGAPDGLARGLDFSHRAQRLKCVGNGVVALQAATAVVQLFRRAMK